MKRKALIDFPLPCFVYKLREVNVKARESVNDNKYIRNGKTKNKEHIVHTKLKYHTPNTTVSYQNKPKNNSETHDNLTYTTPTYKGVRLTQGGSCRTRQQDPVHRTRRSDRILEDRGLSRTPARPHPPRLTPMCLFHAHSPVEKSSCG